MTSIQTTLREHRTPIIAAGAGVGAAAGVASGAKLGNGIARDIGVATGAALGSRVKHVPTFVAGVIGANAARTGKLGETAAKLPGLGAYGAGAIAKVTSDSMITDAASAIGNATGHHDVASAAGRGVNTVKRTAISAATATALGTAAGPATGKALMIGGAVAGAVLGGILVNKLID